MRHCPASNVAQIPSVLILLNVEAVIVVLEALSIVMNGEFAFTSSKVQSVTERAALVLMIVVEKETSADDELMLMDDNDVLPAVTEKRGTFNSFRMNEIDEKLTEVALRRKTACPDAIASTDL